MEGTKMMSDKCLNVVLLGGMGVGKSASGNTILGRHAFNLKKNSSVTRDVAVESGLYGELHITVHDTPGFSGAESKEELGKYEEVLQKCESDLCVFLLVIKAGIFPQEEQEIVKKIEELLGEKRLKNTWILFTRGDQLEDENKTINKVVEENEALKKLIQKYESRFLVFNNKDTEGHGDQINHLLLKLNNYFKNRSKKTLQRISINIQDIPVSSLSSRRIVLLGKSGVGKSAAGNTILGQKEFESAMRMNSVTFKCSDAHATVSGRSLSVVDTPGFFDTKMKPEELVEEIARSVYLSSPGPHAFLIVLRVDDRFTEQELKSPQQIEMMFGQEVLKYSIILFSRGDQLEDESVEELMKENSRLRHLVDQCGGRFHIFNNKDQNNREQVNDLLQKIDSMIEQNGGGYYSNQMYKDAHRYRQEEEEQRKQQEKKQRQEEIDRVKKETREECEAEQESKKNIFQKFYKKYEQNFMMAAATATTCAAIGATGGVIGVAAGGIGGAVCGFISSMFPSKEPFYLDLP